MKLGCNSDIKLWTVSYFVNHTKVNDVCMSVKDIYGKLSCHQPDCVVVSCKLDWLIISGINDEDVRVY